MKIDHQKDREDIGRLVLDAREAEKETWEKHKQKQLLLRIKMDKARAEFDVARKSFEEFHATIFKASQQGYNHALAKIRSDYPGLDLATEMGSGLPRVCAVSGLAIFAGDELYGDDVLKAAVSPRGKRKVAA